MRRKGVTTILILLGCWTQVVFADSIAIKAATPVQISIAPETSVSPGGAATFVVRVTSSLASDHLVINVIQPPATELLSGELQWTGDIQADQVRELRFVLRLPAAAVPAIEVTATIHSASGGQLAASDVYRQPLALPSAVKILQGRTVSRNGRAVVEYPLK